jgi:single-stranded-DNA-specific exonuclease
LTQDILAKELSIPLLLAEILIGRGILDPDEARAFLFPKPGDLSDPFLLPDMEKAVPRLLVAIEKEETLCLYGDYDADGVTSVALMVRFLRQIDLSPLTYIPERQEGYGLNIEAVRGLAAKGVRLLVCLDCGSSNLEEIEEARRLGIDTIVIDHHETGRELPSAVAVVNPKREGSRFPTRDLAACGVTFFLLLALRRTMHGRGLLNKKINLKRELDLVTLGTTGDMVPLRGDNRIIVKLGTEIMRKQPRRWLKSFLDKKSFLDGAIDEYSLGFIMVPRINAAGRVERAETSLCFLTCDDPEESRSLLGGLEKANRRRQDIEERILAEAREMVREQGHLERKSLVLFKKGWDLGVIGIVAQRLTELYGKPSIVITESKGLWKGSGRGGEGIDLYEIVRGLAPLLVRFGGHRYACGVSLAEDNLGRFRDAFESRLRETGIPEKRQVRIDAAARFEDLTGEFMRALELLSPFGMGNPRPNLLMRAAAIGPAGNGRVKIVDERQRVWRGSFRREGPLPDARDIQVVVSPVLREEMGHNFIYLNVKQLLS